MLHKDYILLCLYRYNVMALILAADPEYSDDLLRG